MLAHYRRKVRDNRHRLGEKVATALSAEID
jgi:hypothetical protein